VENTNYTNQTNYTDYGEMNRIADAAGSIEWVATKMFFVKSVQFV